MVSNPNNYISCNISPELEKEVGFKLKLKDKLIEEITKNNTYDLFELDKILRYLIKIPDRYVYIEISTGRIIVESDNKKEFNKISEMFF